MEEAGRVTGSSSSPGAGGRSVDASGDMSRGEKTAWSLKRRGCSKRRGHASAQMQGSGADERSKDLGTTGIG